jgi:fimbrial chaperone protein
MRWGFFALLFSALPVMANEPSTNSPSTILDVAPTTLELKPGAAGLFFVTNHGARDVTVQIEAADWRQENSRDITAPSQELLASPPLAHIAPGARQSVRVMARAAGEGERAYRLLVSELPDPDAGGEGVHVLLQFSVPVFVRHDPRAAPQLSWAVRQGRLIAANAGAQTVKLDSVTIDGAVKPGLVYLLPGAARDIGPAGQGHVRVHDERSGTDLAADIAP